MKKANIALGILASIPFVVLILVACGIGYISRSFIKARALGGPRAIVEVDQSYLKRGFIGIEYEPVPEADLGRLQIVGGVMIKGVIPGGPAEISGMAVGDCLVLADDDPITSGDDMVLLCAAWKPGQVVKLTVIGRTDEAPVERVVECRLISYDELTELRSNLSAGP